MQAAGRRTMPRPAVGVRPSASFYSPAVPRGLRLCGWGFGGHAFAVPDGRRRVTRSGFRAPAVPRSLRLCRGGFVGTPSTFATGAVGVLVFHSLRQIFSRCPH